MPEIELLPQHSEKQFRRYEHIIERIVSAFPAAVAFSPANANLRAITFACRLRDAMRSFQANKWQSVINHTRFCEIADLIVVAQRNHPERGPTVIAGSREALNPMEVIPVCSVAPAVNANAVETLPLPLLNLPDEYLQTLCYLADARALRRPLRVTISSPELAAKLEEQFDISLDPQSIPNQYILI
jgi:hypothetical protein